MSDTIGEPLTREQSGARHQHRGLALCLAFALAVVAAFVYAPAAELPFINYDDFYYGPQNAHVRAGLSREGVVWAFTTYEASNWHPLTWLSLQLDATLFGEGPFGFHLTNVVLHTANTVLLYAALLALTGRVWPSAFAAALFALHPLRVESVAWVSERKDVLSGFFFILTLLAYAWYCRKPGMVRLVPVLLAFGLGLLAKPMLVTLPFVLLLLDYWPLGRKRYTAGSPPWHALRGNASLFLEKIPFFALAAGSCYMTLRAQGGSMADSLSFLARLGNASVAYARYLSMTLWPTQLCIFYPHPGESLSVGAVLLSSAVLLAITLVALYIRRSQPYLIVGWLWFLGMLVPVIGMVQVGQQALADRYTYLPLIGIAIALAWIGADALQHWQIPAWAQLGAASAIIGVLCVLTRTQIAYWEDNALLWQRALEVGGQSAAGHAGLAGVLGVRDERFDAAIEHYRASLALQPNNPEVRFMLAEFLQLRGRLDEALQELRASLRIAPSGGPGARALLLYGRIKEKQGKIEEAVRVYQDALAASPANPAIELTLGNALEHQGDVTAALSHFRATIALKPDWAVAHERLGNALRLTGNRAAAAEELQEAVRLEPRSGLAHLHLGQALQDQGRAAEAEHHYQEALRLQPNLEPAQRALTELLSKRPSK